MGIVQERENGGLDWGDRGGMERSGQKLELLRWYNQRDLEMIR